MHNRCEVRLHVRQWIYIAAYMICHLYDVHNRFLQEMTIRYHCDLVSEVFTMLLHLWGLEARVRSDVCVYEVSGMAPFIGAI